MGYHRAGFEVIGVDIKPQPRYPFRMVVANALRPPFDLRKFDAIHASPPCQAFSPLQSLHQHIKRPDLVDDARRLLIDSGKPYIIENVPSAPLAHGVLLCGTMFGLRVYRHRQFESNIMLAQAEHPKHRVLAGAKGTKGGRGRKAHYEAGGFVTVAGNVGSYCGPAMGIEWMTGNELSQAIPPAYTEFIGK